MLDTNVYLDACRRHKNLEEALRRPNDAMRLIRVLLRQGPRTGLQVFCSGHILNNIRWKLRQVEVSEWGGVTRPAWSDEDIDAFVHLVEAAVAATGGRIDVPYRDYDKDPYLGFVVAHHGAPDREDAIVLCSTAEATPARVIVTSDTRFLAPEWYELPGCPAVEMVEPAWALKRVRKTVTGTTKVPAAL